MQSRHFPLLMAALAIIVAWLAFDATNESTKALQDQLQLARRENAKLHQLAADNTLNERVAELSKQVARQDARLPSGTDNAAARIAFIATLDAAQQQAKLNAKVQIIEDLPIEGFGLSATQADAKSATEKTRRWPNETQLKFSMGGLYSPTNFWLFLDALRKQDMLVSVDRISVKGARFEMAGSTTLNVLAPSEKRP